MYPVRGFIAAKNVFYRNMFSEMTDGEIRAVLDGAAGKKKQRELLDYLTGMHIGEKVNPFFDFM